MFWHFLKVVYSRACESREVWIKVRKLKIRTACLICENYDIIAINLSAKWDGVMKRKVIVSITFVVLLCSIVLCVINQKKAPFIEGVIVEKNERFFTIETDIQEKIVCTLPKEYDYQDISLGDNIRVYYKGEILETSPARIKNVKEIKKI